MTANPSARVTDTAACTIGEVAGVWKRRNGKGTVVLEVTALTPLTAKALHGLEGSAAAYGRFLGRPVELRVEGD